MRPDAPPRRRDVPATEPRWWLRPQVTQAARLRSRLTDLRRDRMMYLGTAAERQVRGDERLRRPEPGAVRASQRMSWGDSRGMRGTCAACRRIAVQALRLRPAGRAACCI
jgi:hypothetical protein